MPGAVARLRNGPSWAHRAATGIIHELVVCGAGLDPEMTTDFDMTAVAPEKTKGATFESEVPKDNFRRENVGRVERGLCGLLKSSFDVVHGMSLRALSHYDNYFFFKLTLFSV